jgi:LmbE family N-acetylglucosaminyl deacetylase
MLTFGPDGLSGHLDHVRMGCCAVEAFRRAEEIAALYTVALPRSLAERLRMQHVCPVPDESIALTADVSSVWENKLAATRCDATQLTSSPIVRASPVEQHLFSGTEYFVRHRHLDGLPLLICVAVDSHDQFLPDRV